MTSASFSHKVVCCRKWGLPRVRRTTFAVLFIILALTRGNLHYMLCVNDQGSMLILIPELSNLVTYEVREMPLTLRSIERIQPARLHTCLVLYSEKGPRPSDRGHRGLGYNHINHTKYKLSSLCHISRSIMQGDCTIPNTAKKSQRNKSKTVYQTMSIMLLDSTRLHHFNSAFISKFLRGSCPRISLQGHALTLVNMPPLPIS